MKRLYKHVIGFRINGSAWSFTDNLPDRLNLHTSRRKRVLQTPLANHVQIGAAHIRIRFVRGVDILSGSKQFGQILRPASSGVDAENKSLWLRRHCFIPVKCLFAIAGINPN
ncbi:MAG: hypothetical protein WCH04_18855 [Gammaproteobacteria bacterium]